MHFAFCIGKSVPHRICGAALFLPFDFFHGEAFENVAFLNIVELEDAHTALKAGSDFLRLVLKPLQRANLASISSIAS